MRRPDQKRLILKMLRNVYIYSVTWTLLAHVYTQPDPKATALSMSWTLVPSLTGGCLCVLGYMAWLYWRGDQ